MQFAPMNSDAETKEELKRIRGGAVSLFSGVATAYQDRRGV